MLFGIFWHWIYWCGDHSLKCWGTVYRQKELFELQLNPYAIVHILLFAKEVMGEPQKCLSRKLGLCLFKKIRSSCLWRAKKHKLKSSGWSLHTRGHGFVFWISSSTCLWKGNYINCFSLVPVLCLLVPIKWKHKELFENPDNMKAKLKDKEAAR